MDAVWANLVTAHRAPHHHNERVVQVGKVQVFCPEAEPCMNATTSHCLSCRLTSQTSHHCCWYLVPAALHGIPVWRLVTWQQRGRACCGCQFVPETAADNATHITHHTTRLHQAPFFDGFGHGNLVCETDRIARKHVTTSLFALTLGP